MKNIKTLVERLGKAGILEHVPAKTLAQGTKHAEDIIALVANEKPERVQGIGDDFIPDTNLYNALGTIYPTLDKPTRAKALRAILSQLNPVNYVYVQNNHTPYIREPRLLGDIAGHNVLYWPGLDEATPFAKRFMTFEAFRKQSMDDRGLFFIYELSERRVHSDFVMAYALLRKDVCNFGTEYIRKAPVGFIQRVVDGIVALRFANVENKREITKGLKRLRELLPPGLHGSMNRSYQAEQWVDKKALKEAE